MEKKDEKLHENVGGEEKSETTEVTTNSEKSTEIEVKKEEVIETPEETVTEVKKDAVKETESIESSEVEAIEEVPEAKSKETTDDNDGSKPEENTQVEVKEEIVPEKEVIEEIESVETSEIETIEEVSEENTKAEVIEETIQEAKSPETTNDDAKPKEEEETASEDVIEEIEESNAEDAEDTDNHQRHQIPILDYHSMSMENLVGELQKLIRTEKVQAIKKHVDDIKSEFDHKFQDFIDLKKEEFIASGGNEIDFRYNSVTKRQFNEVYSDYRDKRNQYYKSLEQNLKANLAKRQEIIEELKGLVNVEEDINTTYKNFKNIQESWRNAGPIPRTHYNDVWRTYHHHIEIFYDFLHLNRELRDLDFKHNLEEKLKIAERAEALAQVEDLGKAFQELQTLHKIWKEDIGPVDKNHREEIWERFSNATKAMHQRRQEFYTELDKSYEGNLVKKHEIIEAINGIASNVSTNHKALQQQIKNVEALRDDFFKAGKVPQKVNEKTWASFKEAVRAFNRNKNNYYKNLKKDQQENLDKKRALLELAISLKDSDEWNTATSEMKRIQSEWKKIGHVPRKFSDKIWNEFKNACNHYFDRLHSQKNSAFKEEQDNFEKKSACMDRLKAFQLGDDREENLTTIKQFINEWKTYGRVPFNKKNIDGKFNKILDAIFKKLDISRQESELLKYGNKIQQLAKADNQRAIYNERTFIRRKMEESKNEILQLENNMQFFSNASEDSPLVKEVIKKLNNHKEALETWKAKLKRLNIMENDLNKEVEEPDAEETASSEEE